MTPVGDHSTTKQRKNPVQLCKPKHGRRTGKIRSKRSVSNPNSQSTSAVTFFKRVSNQTMRARYAWRKASSRVTPATEGIAPLHAARTSQRDPYHVKKKLSTDGRGSE